MHVAAAVGTPVVILIGNKTLHAYLPMGSHHQVVRRQPLTQIAAEDVYDVARSKFSLAKTLEAGGAGKRSPAENTQLIEKLTRSKRSALRNCAQLGRTWNAEFRSVHLAPEHSRLL